MSERWHQVHDGHVRANGDDARPEAVRLADRLAPPIVEMVFAPGARWLVDDPHQITAFKSDIVARGLYGSGAGVEMVRWGE